jgi:hypothetical protein
MAKDNSIMITALPKMTKPLIPLDKYGQPLELPKPNTTNNHEQQIYRLRSRVVGNRQANKCLAVVRTAGHQRTSSKSKLKQSKPATNANYKSTKPMKSKSTSQSKQVKYLTTTKLRKMVKKNTSIELAVALMLKGMAYMLCILVCAMFLPFIVTRSGHL